MAAESLNTHLELLDRLAREMAEAGAPDEAARAARARDELAQAMAVLGEVQRAESQGRVPRGRAAALAARAAKTSERLVRESMRDGQRLVKQRIGVQGQVDEDEIVDAAMEMCCPQAPSPKPPADHGVGHWHSARASRRRSFLDTLSGRGA